MHTDNFYYYVWTDAHPYAGVAWEDADGRLTISCAPRPGMAPAGVMHMVDLGGGVEVAPRTPIQTARIVVPVAFDVPDGRHVPTVRWQLAVIFRQLVNVARLARYVYDRRRGCGIRLLAGVLHLITCQ